MINKTDHLKAGLQPLMAKTLENALAHRIEKEFPRIGGPRICKLCAEMIMNDLHNHFCAEFTDTRPPNTWEFFLNPMG